ncbi:MAG: hypothetical protein NTW21_05885 [Verrucomicrobia bacterium]|nr:hypothetical protein [Verrucomicrobiota bacterium]
MPSDAGLATGCDKQRVILSHTSIAPVTFRMEADFTGMGQWAAVTRRTVPPAKLLEQIVGTNCWNMLLKHCFPDSFGAYWLRLVAEKDPSATATFRFE